MRGAGNDLPNPRLRLRFPLSPLRRRLDRRPRTRAASGGNPPAADGLSDRPPSAVKSGGVKMWMMLGLICSAVSCNWVPASVAKSYDTRALCVEAAVKAKRNTAMYFELRCVRKEE